MNLRTQLCPSVVCLCVMCVGLFAATPDPTQDTREGPRQDPIHARCLAYSPDGKTLACGCTDQTIQLWDVTTGKNTVLRGHERGVSSVAYSPDGKTLASASWDMTIKLWDVATAMEKTTLKGHTLAVTSLAFCPDGTTLISTSLDKTIKLWDLASGKEKTINDSDPGRCVAFSPDGKTLSVGRFAPTIKLWDVADQKEKAVLKPEKRRVEEKGAAVLKEDDREVCSLAFSPDGKLLASGYANDGLIKLWDVAAGKEKHTLAGHGKIAVHSLAFSPDGTLLASGSDDTNVKLWDVATGKERAALKGHAFGFRIQVLRGPEIENSHLDASVFAVAFSPDGKTLASGSDDRTIRLWDVASEKGTATFHVGQGQLPRAILEGRGSVSFSPDGKILASAGKDGSIRLWDTTTWKEKATIKGEGSAFLVAFSPDGKTLASSTRGENTINLWNVATGKTLLTLQPKAPMKPACSLAFSPDSKLLAAGCIDGPVKLWELSTGKELVTLQGRAVTFSPDGKLFAAGGEDGKIVLWDIAGAKEKSTISGDGYNVNSMAFSSDGKTLVSGSHGELIRFWDVASGKLKTLKAHLEPQRPRGPIVEEPLQGHGFTLSVIFSPDGRTLITAGLNGTIKFWDAATGLTLVTLPHQQGRLNFLACSPDGKTLVSASTDIKVWDMPQTATKK